MYLEREVDTLTSLGLAPRQAKVYLAIAKLGTAKVALISRMSQVPREDTYRILSKLQEMGLVQRVITMPIKYTAVPIEAALSFLMQHRKLETAKLEARIGRLLTNFKTMNEKTLSLGSNCQFVLIPRKEGIIRKVLKMIENAQKTVDSITHLDVSIEAQPLFADPARKAMERGVEYRTIITGLDHIDTFLSLDFSYVDAKFVPTQPIRIANAYIYDKKEVLIVTSEEKHLADSPALWSNNPFVVELAQSYFDEMWKKAKPITTMVQ